MYLRYISKTNMRKRCKKGTKDLNLCRNEDTFLPPLQLNYKHLQECMQDKKKNFQSNNNKQTNTIDSYHHQSLKYGNSFHQYVKKRNLYNNRSFQLSKNNASDARSKSISKLIKINQYYYLDEPLLWRLQSKRFASIVDIESQFLKRESIADLLQVQRSFSEDKIQNLIPFNATTNYLESGRSKLKR